MTDERLDPIYECFDTGEYKTAVKLCQKADIAGWPITRALLAYSYACLRKHTDAMTVAHSVMETMPTDEGVLNTLAYTFKACRAEKDLARCYENALNLQPNNESFMVDLFFCYVRMEEPKKMQLLAQKLYKMTAKSSYVFWSVSSMMMQEDLHPAMLTVAERMIEKVYEEGPGSAQTPGAEELELYVNLLCRRDKLTIALEKLNSLTSRSKGQSITDSAAFLANPSNVKIHSLQLSNLKIKLLRNILSGISKQKQSSSAIPTSSEHSHSSLSAQECSYSALMIAEYKIILKSYPDQWESHSQLIQQLLHHNAYTSTSGTSSSFSSSSSSATLTSATTILNSTQENNSDTIQQENRANASKVMANSCNTNEEDKAQKGSTELKWNNETARTVSDHRTYLMSLQTCTPHLRGPYLAVMLLLIATVNELQLRKSIGVSQSRGERSSSGGEGRESGGGEKGTEKEKGGGKKEGEEEGSRDVGVDVGGSDFALTVGSLDNALPVWWPSTLRTISSTTSLSSSQEKIITVADELCHLLLAYVTKFREKQCCFSDIKPFIGLIARTLGKNDSPSVRAFKGFRDAVCVLLAAREKEVRLMTPPLRKSGVLQSGGDDSANDSGEKEVKTDVDVSGGSDLISDAIDCTEMSEGGVQESVQESLAAKSVSGSSQSSDEVKVMTEASAVNGALNSTDNGNSSALVKEGEKSGEDEHEKEEGKEMVVEDDNAVRIKGPEETTEKKNKKKKNKKNKDKEKKNNEAKNESACNELSNIENSERNKISSEEKEKKMFEEKKILAVKEKAIEAEKEVEKEAEAFRASAARALCSCCKLGQIGLYCDYLLGENANTACGSDGRLDDIEVRMDGVVATTTTTITTVATTQSSTDGRTDAHINCDTEHTHSSTHQSKHTQKQRQRQMQTERQGELFSLYTSTKTLCIGGVGGDREVQPGDELLLLVSSTYRKEAAALFKQAHTHTRTNTHSQIHSHSTQHHSEMEIQLMVCACQWASLLLSGIEASPHTYTFKLEILEPFRILNLAESALDSFSGLGTKYVQSDSMSFLINPSLLEGGLILAAHQRHRAVCNFHNNAKRDTLDMIGKCYNHANYLKADEMQRFVKLCKQSLQLALSRTELPLLEMAVTLHTPTLASRYFDDYFENKLVDSQSYLEEGEVHRLLDHTDSNLLVRACSSEFEEASSARTRKQQMVHRLKENQEISRVIYHLISRNVKDAREHLQSWEKLIVSDEVGVTNVEACVPSVSGVSSVQPFPWLLGTSNNSADNRYNADSKGGAEGGHDKSQNTHEYLQWNQKDHGLCISDKERESLLWNVTSNCAELVCLALSLSSTSSSSLPPLVSSSSSITTTVVKDETSSEVEKEVVKEVVKEVEVSAVEFNVSLEKFIGSIRHLKELVGESSISFEGKKIQKGKIEIEKEKEKEKEKVKQVDEKTRLNLEVEKEVVRSNSLRKFLDLECTTSKNENENEECEGTVEVSGDAMLSPNWLRYVSLTVRTVISWCTLLLQVPDRVTTPPLPLPPFAKEGVWRARQAMSQLIECLLVSLKSHAKEAPTPPPLSRPISNTTASPSTSASVSASAFASVTLGTGISAISDSSPSSSSRSSAVFVQLCTWSNHFQESENEEGEKETEKEIEKGARARTKEVEQETTGPISIIRSDEEGERGGELKRARRRERDRLLRVVADKIVSSQSLTCLRLSGCLTAKLEALRLIE